MNIIQFYIDHSIDHSLEHKNVRDGWVGIDCPFCGTAETRGKYHLGYNMDEKYFSCWVCGGHSIPNTISRLIKVSTRKAEEIIEKYGGVMAPRQTPRVRIGTRRFKFPSGSLKLDWQHKQYLKRRGFDWESLAATWGVMGTGPSSRLITHDEEKILNYSNRILAPIIWDNEIVTYQARDITDRHMAKYMACPPERERISHKHILYGLQHEWESRGICVEGIFDAWRFGPKAFATFGVKYTREQVTEIKRHFKEVAIAFDPEEAAQEQARKLMKELNFKGVRAWIVGLPSDPGSMDQEEADELVNSILTYKNLKS
jgi:hypothetical protein